MVRTNRRKNNRIIIIVIIVSFALYMAGVFSGLHTSKLLQKETAKEISFMQEYVELFEKNLRESQLEQIYLKTLDGEEMCDFYEVSIDRLFVDMAEFSKILPYRLEEYEKNNNLSKEYLNLKKEYTQLSIRTWIYVNDYYNNCDNNMIQGLYLYSTTCDTCITQGEELDKLKNLDYNYMIFTINIDSNNSIIEYIKKKHDSYNAPVMYINGEIFKNRVYTADEIEQRLIN